MTNDASRQSLGRLLVERGVISTDQLDAALKIQRAEGGMLGEILTARGWVTPLSIAAAIAKQKVDQRRRTAPTEHGRREGRAGSRSARSSSRRA